MESRSAFNGIVFTPASAGVRICRVREIKLSEDEHRAKFRRFPEQDFGSWSSSRSRMPTAFRGGMIRRLA
jgi:hypothetical protein